MDNTQLETLTHQYNDLWLSWQAYESLHERVQKQEEFTKICNELITYLVTDYLTEQIENVLQNYYFKPATEINRVECIYTVKNKIQELYSTGFGLSITRGNICETIEFERIYKEYIIKHIEQYLTSYQNLINKLTYDNNISLYINDMNVTEVLHSKCFNEIQYIDGQNGKGILADELIIYNMFKEHMKMQQIL